MMNSNLLLTIVVYGASVGEILLAGFLFGERSSWNKANRILQEQFAWMEKQEELNISLIDELRDFEQFAQTTVRILRTFAGDCPSESEEEHDGSHIDDQSVVGH